MKTVSIGVFAYNEERNLAQILEALLHQECRRATIIEILVVSSASTDRTDEIVGFFSDSYPIVRLIRESERHGKAAAINGYLAAKNPSADVCIIASADIIPDSQSVERLAIALSDPGFGMAGGRPMPVNKGDRFLGFVVQLQWKLHHLISLHHPKCGEMVAFQANLATSIPAESPVDEASLEAITSQKGLQLGYVPEATFINRGPDTISDFIAQRRRIACGHRWLRKTEGYKVATGSMLAPMMALMSQPPRRPIEWIWTAGAIGLEIGCRLLGMWDYYFRPRVHQIWRIASSTKQSFMENEIIDAKNENRPEPAEELLWASAPQHEKEDMKDQNSRRSTRQLQ
jgi:poly-beta-1,6-N-acetyl-D-glucosamine synthase